MTDYGETGRGEEDITYVEFRPLSKAILDLNSRAFQGLSLCVIKTRPLILFFNS
jgi:hypothetical protein